VPASALSWQLTWTTPNTALVAVEPRPDEVARHAAVLAAAYNDPHNAPLLGHTEPIDAAGVIAHYADVAAGGGHNFLVYGDGALVGDADLRKVSGGAAEFAFLVAAPAAQGKGLGTRIAAMVYTFAFGELGLDRVYASIVPGNTASRRVFDKLGCWLDHSPAARRFADEPDDVVVVIDRASFVQRHAGAMAEIAVAMR